jgi:hypothetical protein
MARLNLRNEGEVFRTDEMCKFTLRQAPLFSLLPQPCACRPPQVLDFGIGTALRVRIHEFRRILSPACRVAFRRARIRRLVDEHDDGSQASKDEHHASVSFSLSFLAAVHRAEQATEG